MSHNLIAFVCGLHRSGTTPLYRALALHPDASDLPGEGQGLQSAYPTARGLGGPGCFGFDPRAHLTENSSLATNATRSKLLQEWGQHWDFNKPVLLEKSPPNLLKTRCLQALFPEAVFVVIVRHPIAVTAATAARWDGCPPKDMLRHWFVCHDLFMADAPFLKRLIVLRYEDLIASPNLVMRIQEALGLSSPQPPPQPKTGLNQHYFENWTMDISDGLERSAHQFGYSLIEPSRSDIPPAPGVAQMLGSWK